MDNAVALVQAYLRLNGYLTVSEHPVIARQGNGARMVTDLDMLAIRFPQMRQGVLDDGTAEADSRAPDPALALVEGLVDMLIGEVKEGRAELNAAATNPAVLRAALLRFGCCGADEAVAAVDQLQRRGTAVLSAGHRVRLVAFGSTAPGAGHPRHLTITLAHVVEFLTAYVRREWDVLRHTDSKDPALGMLMLLEKARRTAAAGRGRRATVD
ncbi:MAG: hypothetical protein LOY01_03225 [Brachybacterium paraconglomeratum]|jgi:hypothetical protein|nr:hypothetical protein [Brachybacterium paraconglomeratum]